QNKKDGRNMIIIFLTVLLNLIKNALINLYFILFVEFFIKNILYKKKSTTGWFSRVEWLVEKTGKKMYCIFVSEIYFQYSLRR
ncbi:MAG: hypothetical protein LBE13_09780, partial [Bacteroidales bacterium]|nr:hypothetical protein [Bacteroidales bacterium]